MTQGDKATDREAQHGERTIELKIRFWTALERASFSAAKPGR